MSSVPLPPMRRVVTAHNQQGQAIVAHDSQLSSELLPHGVASITIWSSETSPAVVDSTKDNGRLDTGFVNNGSIFRIVDVPPRTVGALHRSLSLDYVVVLRGSVVLVLDDGTRTTINQGEFVVQNATMHGWDNDTDQWARFIAIMLPAEAPVVAGEKLETDLAKLFG